MNILKILCCCLALLLSQFFLVTAAQSTPRLTLADCEKCHLDQTRQIAAGGRAHRDQMTCLDCHVGHPPPEIDNIPACTNCHVASPHTEMVDCTGCHQRTQNCRVCHQVHQPMSWTDAATAQLHCRSCHAEAVALIQTSKSKHQSLACTFCHPMHRRIQECSDCHGLPHAKGTHDMFACQVCHNRAHELVINSKN